MPYPRILFFFRRSFFRCGLLSLGSLGAGGCCCFFLLHLLPTVSGSDCFSSPSASRRGNMKGKRLQPMQVLMKVWEVDWKEVGKAGFLPGFGSSCVIGFTL